MISLRWLNPFSMLTGAMTPTAAPASRPASSEASYTEATAVTDEVVELMRQRAASKDPVRALLADIWMQRHNVPALTTIFEAAEEMKAATQYSGSGNRNEQRKDQP